MGRAHAIKENMIMTVEPGIYFTRYLINEALADEKTKECFDEEVLKK